MSDRDDQGKFTKGNPGGPGRPRRSVEQEYLDVLVSAISPDDWRTVVLKALELAQKGDPRAREFLAKHGRVVVKPNWGNRGIGISTDVREFADLLAAFAFARAHDIPANTVWNEAYRIGEARIGQKR